MPEEPPPGSPFENDPLAQAILREGLAIQDQFAAEPVYARTGKGFLRSRGVAEIARIKEEEASAKRGE